MRKRTLNRERIRAKREIKKEAEELKKLQTQYDLMKNYTALEEYYKRIANDASKSSKTRQEAEQKAASISLATAQYNYNNAKKNNEELERQELEAIKKVQDEISSLSNTKQAQEKELSKLEQERSILIMKNANSSERTKESVKKESEALVKILEERAKIKQIDDEILKKNEQIEAIISSNNNANSSSRIETEKALIELQNRRAENANKTYDNDLKKQSESIQLLRDEYDVFVEISEKTIEKESEASAERTKALNSYYRLLEETSNEEIDIIV